jgi:hypothetical protein
MLNEKNVNEFSNSKSKPFAANFHGLVLKISVHWCNTCTARRRKCSWLKALAVPPTGTGVITRFKAGDFDVKRDCLF